MYGDFSKKCNEKNESGRGEGQMREYTWNTLILPTILTDLMLYDNLLFFITKYM